MTRRGGQKAWGLKTRKSLGSSHIHREENAGCRPCARRGSREGKKTKGGEAAMGNWAQRRRDRKGEMDRKPEEDRHVTARQTYSRSPSIPGRAGWTEEGAVKPGIL